MGKQSLRRFVNLLLHLLCNYFASNASLLGLDEKPQQMHCRYSWDNALFMHLQEEGSALGFMLY